MKNTLQFSLIAFGHHDNLASVTPKLGGVGIRYTFANGYGASVVRNLMSYGHESGLWELAVLDRTGNLCYDTPITDDVLGFLSEADVRELLDQIQALPNA